MEVMGKKSKTTKTGASKKVMAATSCQAVAVPITPAARASFREWLATVACVSEEQATRVLHRIKNDNDFVVANNLQSCRDELFRDFALIRDGKIKTIMLSLPDGRRFVLKARKGQETLET